MEALHSLLEGQVPVFEQTWDVMDPQNHRLLEYNLPSGVVANVVAVDLIGKHVEQHPGSGYFACVESFDCRGFPLVDDSVSTKPEWGLLHKTVSRIFGETSDALM